MIKKIFIVATLVLTSILTQAQDGKKIESKIQKVTLFLNSAQIMRTAAVAITPGTSTYIFTGISPSIDVQSLQVRAAGDFTILSVKTEINFLETQTKQKNLEELQNQQKQISDKIAMENNLLAIDNQEETMLTKNQVVTGDNASLDLLKLKQALDFQTQRLTEIKKRQQATNERITALRLELQKYNKQIADFNKANTSSTNNILVTVSSKIATQIEFTLSYVVNNANWYPTYDIRAKNVNSPISIAYKANVSQQSGEDWKNIKLILSTGNPTISGNKPELKPYYLNFGMYNAGSTGSITRVTGKLTDSRNNETLIGATVIVKGTSIGTTVDMAGNYSIQIPSGNQTLEYRYVGYETTERPVTSGVMNVSLNPMVQNLQEVVVVNDYGNQGLTSALSGKVAGVSVGYSSNSGIRIRGAAATTPIAVQSIENQTNIEFNIDNPYTIPSDGKQYTVEINQTELPAIYQYAVTSKLSSDVFLTAQLTDWNKYNFLSGEANLFFEGTYIGKSLIDANSTSDTLKLSLGADKNIVVTRTLQKDVNEKQIFGSNRRETRNWTIDIKNRKNQAIDLLVEEQVPVSQNSAIEVDVQELSGGIFNKETGKVMWTVPLKPGDEKKLSLKYQVRYPKNQSVIVQ